MSARTIYVPAEDRAEAQAVGDMIASGRTGCREHYRSRSSAQAVADHLNRLALEEGRSIRRSVFPVDLRPVDDCVIANVWPVDRIGEAAVALLIVIGGPFLVGWASWL